MNAKPRSELLISVALVMVVIFVGVRISCIQNFWLDELLTWYLATDRSWAHMIKALSAGTDGMMPFYHSIMWAWAQLLRCFGLLQGPSKEAFFRFPSVLFFALAVLFMQRSLRPAFNPAASTFATLAPFFLSTNAIEQISDARGYTLTVMLCTASILIAVRLPRTEDNRRRNQLLCLNALIQGAAVLTHPFAGLYSAATLAGVAIYHLRKGAPAKNKTFKLHILSYLIGWLALIPWLPGLRMQMDINHPYTWVTVPTFKQLTQMFAPDWTFWPFTLYLIAILALYSLTPRNSAAPTAPDEASPAATDQVRLLVWIGLCYLGLIIAVWCASHFVQPLFTERYFLPNLAARAIFIAIGLRAITRETPALPTNLLTGLACICVPVLALRWSGLPLGSGNIDETFLHPDIPVVCQTGNRYLPRHCYFGSGPLSYYLVMDWQSALRQKANRGFACVDYKVMNRLNKFYPDDHIMQLPDFLAKFGTFYLFDEASNPISADLPASEFTWERVPPPANPLIAERLDPVYLITRKDRSPAAVPAAPSR